VEFKIDSLKGRHLSLSLIWNVWTKFWNTFWSWMNFFDSEAWGDYWHWRKISLKQASTKTIWEGRCPSWQYPEVKALCKWIFTLKGRLRRLLRLISRNMPADMQPGRQRQTVWHKRRGRQESKLDSQAGRWAQIQADRQWWIGRQESRGRPAYLPDREISQASRQPEKNLLTSSQARKDSLC